MFSKTVNFFFFLSLFSVAVQGQESDHLRYVDEFKEVAIREMERAGIPASIKLAQGILESNAGKSDLARRANNHFGIKCGNDWDGKTYYKKDDDYNDKGQLVESCFRSYKNPEASFIAHSEFLRDPKKQYRYGFLFRIDPTDYKAWAEGLRRAGYATSANYPTKLIDIIERYQLNRYDELTSPEVIAGEDVTTGEG
ncbi:MAG: glucosaminidase domain-containing protein, partial [Calditrichaeota bacterium]|nr:glucosaminidase domain-containing protein [Calditrichota bacterium]